MGTIVASDLERPPNYFHDTVRKVVCLVVLAGASWCDGVYPPRPLGWFSHAGAIGGHGAHGRFRGSSGAGAGSARRDGGGGAQAGGCRGGAACRPRGGARLCTRGLFLARDGVGLLLRGLHVFPRGDRPHEPRRRGRGVDVRRNAPTPHSVTFFAAVEVGAAENVSTARTSPLDLACASAAGGATAGSGLSLARSPSSCRPPLLLPPSSCRPPPATLLLPPS